jgi:hypothetical protein
MYSYVERKNGGNHESSRNQKEASTSNELSR